MLNPEPLVASKLFFKEIGQNFIDVAYSIDGVVWGVDTANGIFKYENGSWSPTYIGQATKIEVDAQGDLWTITSLGRVMNYSKGHWFMKADNGTAREISLGADGSIWILGTHEVENNGFPLFYYDQTTEHFISVNTYAVALVVGLDGQPWVVNIAGDIFKRSGSGEWTKKNTNF